MPDKNAWLIEQHKGMLAQMEGILATQLAATAHLERAIEAKRQRREEEEERAMRHAVEVEDGIADSGDMSLCLDIPGGVASESSAMHAQRHVRDASPDRSVADAIEDRETDVKRAVAQVRDFGIISEEEAQVKDVWGLPPFPEGVEQPVTVKPWQRSLIAPSVFMTEDPPRPRDAAPSVTLELNHIFGYKARSSHNNIEMVGETTAMYPVGCTVVMMDLNTKEQQFFQGHDSDVTCVCYSTKLGIAATGQLGRVARLLVWQPSTGRILAELPSHLRGVAAIAFSDDGLRLASVGCDGDHTLLIHDLSEVSRLLNTDGVEDARAVCPEVLRQSSGPLPALSACFLQDDSESQGQYRVAVVGSGGIHIWATSPGSPYTQRAVKYGSFSGYAAGTFLSCTSVHPYITLVGAATGALLVFSGSTLVEVIDGHKRALTCIRVVRSPNSSSTLTTSSATVLTSGEDGFVHSWRIDIGCEVVSGSQGSLTVTPTVTRLPTSSNSYSVTEGGECLGVDPVVSIAYTPQNEGTVSDSPIVFGSASGALWTATLGKPGVKRVTPSHHGDFQNAAGYGELWAGAAHPGGVPLVATAGEDRTMRIWDIAKRACVRSAELPDKAVCLAWSPKGKYLALGSLRGSISLYHSKTLFALCSYRPSLKRVQCVSFSPDGTVLAVGGADCTIRLYRVCPETDELRLSDTIATHTTTVTHLDFSTDGCFLQSCSQGYELLFHRIEEGTVADVNPADVRDVEWATHSSILGWNVQGIWPQEHLEGSEVNATCLLVRPGGGSLIASAEVSGLVKLFAYPCVGSGLHPVEGTLPRRPSCVAALGHSSNVALPLFVGGKYLVTLGASDNAVFVWRLSFLYM